jgi:ribosomal protein L22
MSPAPRKKKDEAAPTAAEVEAQVSEEAAKSVPKAESEPDVDETKAAEVEASAEEEQPKPPARKKPAAKKKAAPKAEKAEADEADAEEAEEKPKPKRKPAAKKPAKDEEPKEEAKPKPPARKRDQPRKREPGEPAVVVRAQARYVRTSARKARLVCDHIRGKDVEQARAILSFTPRGAAKPWLKLLESAIANAEHNHELVGDELKIASIHADEGPTLKRYRPRAMGRATRIRKRTSHLTITLTPKE